MKLAVFIPAYNEADTIGGVLAEIPRKIPGIDEVKVFVVDDGSTDSTYEVASTYEVETIRIRPNRGLANAFRAGMAAALADGADLIAHLDADGQYDPKEIPKLLAPILAGEADLVTGDRQIGKCAFLGPARVYGNMLGSWFLRAYAGVRANDASCGFRAYSRAAAALLEVHSTHTYTHETLIEARYKGLRVAEVPIAFRHRGKISSVEENKYSGPSSSNRPTEKPVSRLTAGLHRHIFKSLSAIFAAKERYSK
jgi:glycosyltransferase involved in cell wall biosynthesis